MQADLEFVADVLERAGVALTLVRDERLRPVIVVDGALRAHAIDALAASAATEPFYAKVRQTGPEPLFEMAAPEPVVSAVTLFRPRVSRNGSLRYGAEFGVRLEFWRFGGKTVEAPRANALTRRIIATQDLVVHDGRAVRAHLAHPGGHVRPPPARGDRRHRHGVLVGGRLIQRIPAPARAADAGVRRRRRG